VAAFYSGPYLVTEILGSVNLRLQKSAKSNLMVVHVDKVKHCTGTTPVSWLGTDTHHVIPVDVEHDVIANMFGGVDRAGGLFSTDDTSVAVIGRPKRNAGVPAWFLCRIYASYDTTLKMVTLYDGVVIIIVICGCIDVQR